MYNQDHSYSLGNLNLTQQVLREFGQQTDDASIQLVAQQAGLFDASENLQLEDIATVLTNLGVTSQVQYDANILDITDKLAHGKQVVVEIDSGELDGGILAWLKDVFIGSTPDKSMAVMGIDATDANNPKVVLTDPMDDSVRRTVDLDDFMDAWSDSRCKLLATDMPSLSAMGSFANQGLPDMHLPKVHGVDYNVFDAVHQKANEDQEFWDGITKHHQAWDRLLELQTFAVTTEGATPASLLQFIEAGGGPIEATGIPDPHLMDIQIGGHDFSMTGSQLQGMSMNDKLHLGPNGELPQHTQDYIRKTALHLTDEQLRRDISIATGDIHGAVGHGRNAHNLQHDLDHALDDYDL